jgi:predicted enzyme related to lactoylglutathione lyase
MDVVGLGVCIFTGRWFEVIHFYRETIGLKVREEDSYHIIFDIGDGYLLVQRCAPREDCEEKGRVVLRLDVLDLDAMIERLEGKNVEVKKKSSDYDWEPLAIVVDPDGNQVHFKQKVLETYSPE